MGFDDFSDFEAPVGSPPTDEICTPRRASDQERAREVREVSDKAAAMTAMARKVLGEVRADERARVVAHEDDRTGHP